MTECKQETFAFTAHFSRQGEAGFPAGQGSSDGGALLLCEVDSKINLLGRLTACFSDARSPLRITHQLSEMLAQHIPGLALGYEDRNDHEQLRSGQSEIRRYPLENDLVEAIVALPMEMFYNTGIATYLWIVTNHKSPQRKRKLQLIGASSFFSKMRRRARASAPSTARSAKSTSTRSRGSSGEFTQVRRPNPAG